MSDSSPASSSASAAQSACANQSDESAAAPLVSTNTAADQPADVQPLLEQTDKKPRQSPPLRCPVDGLAKVELQLMLQFMDTNSKLKAARCNRSLLQAAHHPFAWKGAPATPVAVRSAADVEFIGTSLPRYAPIGLRYVGMESLQCITAVPHLIGLELIKASQSSADDLARLLQHPNLARLQTMQMDAKSSYYSLTVDTTRLIARLPQLRTFDMFLHDKAAVVAALLQPLAGAPALTDLTLRWTALATANTAVLSAINGCTRLHRLSLHCLQFQSGDLIALCSSSNMRRLQHLELDNCGKAAMLFRDIEPPGADEYRAAISALEQLQSLALGRVNGINSLQGHLHRAPALRLLSFRCEVDFNSIDAVRSSLPSHGALSALLKAAPQLDVHLLMPATLERWLAVGHVSVASRAKCEQQWRELQLMGAEMDRVTVTDEAPAFV